MRNALLVLLKTLGYAPIEYASAERALSDATFEGAGCMLVDIHLPGMRGTDMVRQLRARGCDWPVVFTTGHDDERYRIEAETARAVAAQAVRRRGVKRSARPRESRRKGLGPLVLQHLMLNHRNQAKGERHDR